MNRNRKGSDAESQAPPPPPPLPPPPPSPAPQAANPAATAKPALAGLFTASLDLPAGSSLTIPFWSMTTRARSKTIVPPAAAAAAADGARERREASAVLPLSFPVGEAPVGAAARTRSTTFTW